MTDTPPGDFETSSLVPEPAGLFTFEEYRRALSLVLPDEEAFHVAAAVAATDDGSRPGERTTYGEELLEDCLILLSFLSPDLALRVERYRAGRRDELARFGFGQERLDSKERRYQRRREELEQRLRAEGKFPG
jgi:hypothetical protein